MKIRIVEYEKKVKQLQRLIMPSMPKSKMAY